jgi:hypothetical protein
VAPRPCQWRPVRWWSGPPAGNDGFRAAVVVLSSSHASQPTPVWARERAYQLTARRTIVGIRSGMLTFVQFLEELTQQEVAICPAEVQRMVDRYGQKTLHMGNLQENGSLTVPVDCIVEAAQSLGNRTLTEAVEGLRSEQVVPMLESVESLVERVAEARKRKLSRLIDVFQSTPDGVKAHQQWKEIEKMIFGVDFDAAH